MAKYEAKTNENKCIFCEIAQGRFETPGIFWQDDEFMAFLSIDPNTPGFSVVIPKEHFDSDFQNIPDETLSKLILASKKVAGILENYYEDTGRIGLIIEGMGINHAHIKLVPMHGTEYLKRGEWRQALSHHEEWSELYDGFISSAGGPMARPEELKELAEKLKNSQKNP